jgi:hypothetical protein
VGGGGEAAAREQERTAGKGRMGSRVRAGILDPLARRESWEGADWTMEGEAERFRTIRRQELITGRRS